MNKRLASILLTVAMLLMQLVGVSTVGAEAAAMTPGSYTAVCHGFYGDFDITVTVSETAITQIVLGEYLETEAVGGKALNLLTASMIQNNTSGVDTISGATVTSIFFRNAVVDCLTQAGAPAEMMEAPAALDATDETIVTDVLVIGAGAAGYSAAITAAQDGAQVLLIEKQDIVGGSTVVSAGIVYAALDEADEATMVDYYMERAQGHADREMLTTFAENSLDTIAFLEDAGVQWLMAVPAGSAPQPRARFSMHAEGPAMIGSALIVPLDEKARSLGVDVRTGVKATALLTQDDAVIGASAQSKSVNYTIEANAVILATGGFDASAELVEKYSPVAIGDVVLSNKGNVGEGMIMAMDIGAASEFSGGMIGFQAVSGTLPESGYNSVAMGSPLFVQADGTFISLSNDYPMTYTALKASGASDFYGIYDAAGADSAQRAVDVGFGHKEDTIEALAEAAGMDAAKLADAVAQAEVLTTAPYFAAVVRPATIGSMGGLITNTQAEVLAEATGEPILGLYAAGEVANPAFYYQEYPASGSSNCISMTFGRIAGGNAATYAGK